MRFMILLCVISLISFSAEVTPKTSLALPAGGTFHFTVYVNNNQDTKTNNNTTLVSNQIEKHEESARSLVKKIADPVKELSRNLKTQLTDRGSQFFWHYKWHLLAATSLGAYAYLAYYLFSGNRYLANPQLWSSWHQELSFEQILAIPQAQFAQDLVREIQRRYNDPSTLTNLVTPLTRFINAIDEEEQTLKSYQSTFAWLSYLKLTRLVPMTTVRFTKITERLQRLAYYKNTFQSWAADFQLEQATKQTRLLLAHHGDHLYHDAKFINNKIRAQLLALMRGIT